MRITTALAIVFLTATVMGARADDVADGRKIVERNCVACHKIQTGDPARHPDAPAFADIAALYPPDALAETFAEGAMVGHIDMPEFEFTADEIRHLVRFLETLRPKDGKAKE